LVEDLNLHQGVTTIFCDYQNVIHLIKHQMNYEIAKYIDAMYRLIR